MGQRGRGGLHLFIFSKMTYQPNLGTQSQSGENPKYLLSRHPMPFFCVKIFGDSLVDGNIILFKLNAPPKNQDLPSSSVRVSKPILIHHKLHWRPCWRLPAKIIIISVKKSVINQCEKKEIHLQKYPFLHREMFGRPFSDTAASIRAEILSY